jgi:hypothetical protein
MKGTLSIWANERETFLPSREKKCKQGIGGRSEGKRPLRRARPKWEDNIKIYVT